MAFIPKDMVQGEAERLGVDLTGLTWPQTQKALSDARKAAGEAVYMADKVVEPKKAKVDKTAKPTMMVRGIAHKIIHEDDPMSMLQDKTILISPEMAPTKIQPFHYDEIVGDELDVEEVNMELGKTEIPAQRNYTTGTYKIKNKTGRKTVALSAIPKENAAITFRPSADMFPVVKFGNSIGYLWTHHRMSNVKSALIESGYYMDYRDKILEGEYLQYATGLMIIDINFTHHIMNEIQRKEKAKRSKGNDYI